MYPKILKDEKVFPLVGETLAQERPLVLSLSDKNKEVLHINTYEDDEALYRYMMQKYAQTKRVWSVSEYLGRRAWMRRPKPEEPVRRDVHVGIDVGLAKETPLHAPIDGMVVVSECEEGQSNAYGGLAVLKHSIKGVEFYSLYGHLDKSQLPSLGKIVAKGEVFAQVGEFRTNHNLFYHTHLQILTKEAFEKGWVHKGYCYKEEIQEAKRLCPNPLPLLIYGHRCRGE